MVAIKYKRRGDKVNLTTSFQMKFRYIHLGVLQNGSDFTSLNKIKNLNVYGSCLKMFEKTKKKKIQKALGEK